MPLYDFVCTACHHRFEELLFEGDAYPECPLCGKPAEKQMSAPSPLKTGAFPYPVKPGTPVHPLAQKMMGGGQQLAGCNGHCATCPSQSAD